jgi:hypothetical protein
VPSQRVRAVVRHLATQLRAPVDPERAGGAQRPAVLDAPPPPPLADLLHPTTVGGAGGGGGGHDTAASLMSGQLDSGLFSGGFGSGAWHGGRPCISFAAYSVA